MSRRDDNLADFWTFCTDALHIPLHEKPHREMVEFYADEASTNKMMLVPRECWKTSIGAVAYPLWRVLRAWYLFENPAFRVIVDSATTDLSKMVVNSIAGLTQEPRFIEVFGRLFLDERKKKSLNNGRLNLSFRIGAAPMIREANFNPSGIGAEKTGQHCELLILDDLVTRINVRTPEQREKVWDHYRLMQAIISNDVAGNRTEQVLNGTRYHDGDLYGRIIKQDKELVAEGKAPVYSKMIRAARSDSGELFFPGEIGKPGGLPDDLLKDKREKMRGLFYAQYMNDPNKENAPFKANQLHWKSTNEFPPLYKVRLTIDPAIKETNLERGDFCCMVVGGWDQWHKPHVLDVSMRRDLAPGGFISEMLRLARRSAVEGVVIEDDGTLAGMEILWRQEMKRIGYFVPVRTLLHNSHEGKESRWIELREYAERGGITLNDEIPESYKVEIEDEWTRAPFGTYDDFMDAMYLQTQLLPLGFGEDLPPTVRARMMGDDRSPEEIVQETHKTAFLKGTLQARFPNVASLRHEDALPEPNEDLALEMEKVI